MNSDVAFRIGSTHQVCQDYARAGSVAGLHYAIISDGCSSSPDTDVGARILVIEAESSLRMAQLGCPGQAATGLIFPKCIPMIAGNAQSTSKLLGLPHGHLDATLGIVTAFESDGLVSLDGWLFGDGVIVTKMFDTIKKTEVMNVTTLQYESGYPDYPSYSLDAKRAAAVKPHLVGKVTYEVYSSEFKDPICWSAEKHEGPYRRHESFGPSDYLRPVYMAVMSDGVMSFVKHVQTETSKTDSQMPLRDVLGELLSFKGYQGVFVQRRMQKFAKDCVGCGMVHHDDLSLGVVSVMGGAK